MKIATFNKGSIYAINNEQLKKIEEHYKKRISIIATQEEPLESINGPPMKNCPKYMKNGIIHNSEVKIISKKFKKDYDLYKISNALARYFKIYPKQSDNLFEDIERGTLRGILLYGSKLYELRCDFEKKNKNQDLIMKLINIIENNNINIVPIHINNILEDGISSPLINIYRALFMISYITQYDVTKYKGIHKFFKNYDEISEKIKIMFQNMYPLIHTLIGWHYIISALYNYNNKTICMTNTHLKPDTEIAVLQALIIRKMTAFNEDFQKSDINLLCGDFNMKYGDLVHKALLDNSPIEILEKNNYILNDKIGLFLSSEQILGKMNLNIFPPNNFDDVCSKYYSHRRLTENNEIYESFCDHIFSINKEVNIKYLEQQYIEKESEVILPNKQWASDHRIVIAEIDIYK